MSTSPKPDEICIGLSLEADLLRLATVGREGRSMRVMNLATITLPELQYVPQQKDPDVEEESGGFDQFEDLNDEDGDYSNVQEFLSAHYISGATIAVGLGEPQIRTLMLPLESKESDAKLIKRILGELQQSLNIELSKDRVAFQPVGSSSVLASARVESTPLLEVLTTPLGMERRPTRLSLLSSNDISLISLVRVHFRFKDDEIVQVVNVKRDETNLYIMKGYDIRYIAPPVQQGSNDRDIVPMLYNRIELAAENAGYPKADTFVLCGDAEDIGLKEEILHNNPQAVFHSMNQLRVRHSGDETILRDMKHFLIPISLAWESLQPKNPHFYRLNLVPRRIRDEQKKMKLAWHGLMLLILLFAATTGLTIVGLENQMEIARESDALAYEKRQVEEQQAIVQQISALETRSASILAATTTLDTLLRSSEVWSETLDTLSKAAAGLNNMWLSEMKPDGEKGKMAVVGYSLTRASVPEFSHRVGKTLMREISVEHIGTAKLFRFDIALDLPDEFPYGGSPATAWHDSVKTAVTSNGKAR